jgi:hypothetical protein
MPFIRGRYSAEALVRNGLGRDEVVRALVDRGLTREEAEQTWLVVALRFALVSV